MAVAFDAATTATHALSGPVTPLNFNHTVVSVAGGGYIVVGVAIGRQSLGNMPITCTIGGASATQIGTVNSNNGASGAVVVFGLISNATGTVAISVGWTVNDGDLEIAAISFTGVHQSVSTGSAFTAFGASAAPSVGVTDSVSGDLVVDTLVQGSGSNVTSGQTERWDVAQNGGSAGGCGAGSTAAGASGTVTMSYTIVSDSWGLVAFALKAAAGAGITAAQEAGIWAAMQSGGVIGRVDA